MLAVLVSLFLDLAAASPSAGPLLVVAGKQLGPLKLGMSANELGRLGATITDGEATLGALTASLRAGHIKRIEAHLNFADRPRLLVGSNVFQLEFLHHTAGELVGLLSGCGKPRHTGDGKLFRVWRCAGIRIEERLADGDPELNLYVE